MVKRSRKLLLSTALISALLSILFPRCGSRPPRRPVPIAGAGVHGSVLTTTQQNVQILVPDFEVFLRNTATGAASAPVKTDLFGRYIFRSQPQGRYQLCWNASGWVPGCAPTAVTIRIDTKYLPPTQVRPLITDMATAVSGRVAQGDGSSPWFVDPYFGINQTAIVTASAGASVVATARANASGEYVLTSVPRSGATLKATVGGASITQNVVPSDFIFVPLTLKNRPPLLTTVAAFVGGRGVRDVEPGIDVDVVAEAVDPDGDALRIEWRAAPADGLLTGRGTRARWSLPREGGRRVAYVSVSDGNGGFARKQIVLASGLGEVQFSGDVLTQSGSPIVDATITINGGPAALSDNRGAFRAQLERADSYTVTVTKPGFAPASRIYDHGVRDVYRLVRAQTRTVDPRGVIDFTDNREELQRKRLRGARFVIPPNALVDASGAAPSGLLTNSTATLDITSGEMPGNFGAIAGGRETNLISFGAVFTEFTDSSNRRYNLRPGTTARMTLPVPPAMLATAPPTIVLWSYNEATGFWDDSAGNATLDRSLGAYVGEVRHFSTVNADIASGAAACLRVSLDSSVPFSHLKVQVTYDSGPTVFAQAPEMLLDAADNGLIRLPPNDNVKIRVIDVATNAEITNAVILDNGTTPAPGGVVNLGPATTPLDPLPPFTNCHAVVIKLDLPARPGNPASAFLTFAFQGIGSEAEAIGYYATVDPGSSWNGQTWSGGSRSTLGAWWAQAGFGPNGEDLGGTRAAYLNHNDLGFGRDMHIRSVGSNVYAYVTNYGGADQNPNNANLAQTANQSIAGATVAMEYTAQAGVTLAAPIVKFFVYGGGTAAAPRVNSANLDTFGEKYVPNLCQNCHGGEFYAPVNAGAPTPDEVSLRPAPTNPIGASFREFDVPAFRYPGGSATPDAPTLQALFDLNQLVKLSNPQPAIKDLIDGWYTSAPPAQDNTFTPTAWQLSASHISLYRDVVATSCRTCHIAFSNDDPSFGINWTTFAQFATHNSGIGYYVCGPSSKFMPHALMTYKNFWLSTSPHRPAVLRDFSDPANGWPAPIGTCP